MGTKRKVFGNHEKSFWELEKFLETEKVFGNWKSFLELEKFLGSGKVFTNRKSFYEPEKFLETAERVMHRREMDLSSSQREMLTRVWRM